MEFSVAPLTRAEIAAQILERRGMTGGARLLCSDGCSERGDKIGYLLLVGC